jgi:hypothetical protein
MFLVLGCMQYYETEVTQSATELKIENHRELFYFSLWFSFLNSVALCVTSSSLKKNLYRKLEISRQKS